MRREETLAQWLNQLTVSQWQHPAWCTRALRRWLDQQCLTRTPAWSGLHPSWWRHSTEQEPAGTAEIAHSGRLRFGGWSVLSWDGDWRTGWYPDGELTALGRHTPADHQQCTQPTEICVGVMRDCLEEIASWGLHISRARVTISKPGQGILWHRDSSSAEQITARIQLPLLSNSDHEFHSETSRWHLASTGQLYVLNTNHLHRTVNGGRDVRFNLIADIDVHRLPSTLAMTACTPRGAVRD